VGLDDAGAGGRGRRPDRGPRQDTRRSAARHRRDSGDGRRGLERGAEACLRRLADNQLAITGSGWDPELLRLELGELKLDGFDLSLTGFGDLELKDLLADRTEGLTDPDDAPAVPEHPVSQTGDLWLLGRHRLLCGDSTVAADVAITGITFCCAWPPSASASPVSARARDADVNQRPWPADKVERWAIRSEVSRCSIARSG
jgi:hypothetical protein